MKLRTHLLLFVVVFAFEVNRVVGTFGNTAPDITDLLEVHNIAYNLAQGRGYRFDWDDPKWRRLLHPLDANHGLGFILARRSAHTTMFRPPLTPLVVAGLIKVFPEQSFAAWRTFDCAAFSAGACVLCELAYASGSFVAMVTMLLLLLFDPLLQVFVPGCWTEGVAFDLLSLLLLLAINPWRIPTQWHSAISGIVIGLLCLDRAVFVLMILPLCFVISAATVSSVSGQIKVGKLKPAMMKAGTILMICMLVQMPWWTRNMAVSGRWLPLGTQGGFNLPDEYGDVPLTQGSWTGFGMAIAWTPMTLRESDLPVPPGFSPEESEALSPGHRRMQVLLAATFCESLNSEIAVNDRGVESARGWIRRHFQQIPRLMLLKALALVTDFQPLIITSGFMMLVGFGFLPKARQLLLVTLLIASFYLLTVVLTHVVPGRFLVPILPMLFIANAVGAAGIIRLMANAIRSTRPRTDPAVNR